MIFSSDLETLYRFLLLCNFPTYPTKIAKSKSTEHMMIARLLGASLPRNRNSFFSFPSHISRRIGWLRDNTIIKFFKYCITYTYFASRAPARDIIPLIRQFKQGHARFNWNCADFNNSLERYPSCFLTLFLLQSLWQNHNWRVSSPNKCLSALFLLSSAKSSLRHDQVAFLVVFVGDPIC